MNWSYRKEMSVYECEQRGWNLGGSWKFGIAPAVSFLNRRSLQVGETATMVTAKRLRVLLEEDQLLNCLQWAVSIRGRMLEFGFSACSYFITHFCCCFFET